MNSDSIQKIREAEMKLFDLSKKLKAKRIRDYSEASLTGGDQVKILRSEMEDNYLLFVTLHLLVQGDQDNYLKRLKHLEARLFS